MTINLGKLSNNRSLDSLTYALHALAKEYIRGKFNTVKLYELEQYLKENLGLRKPLFDCLIQIVDRMRVTRYDNEYVVTIQNGSEDRLYRMLTYGGLGFRGDPIIEDAIRYAVCYL